ncbi:MAG: zinc-ribbon domain-containing protein, partial [Pyrinomonadaceae bacterium]|nr:zinc-ribbon domain-containing protein [Pyrinomonadaceae bacterium]
MSAAQVSLCPACGAEVQRSSARFCSTCGRSLDALGYRPADSLRASYHQHRARIVVKAATPKWVRGQRRIICVGGAGQKTIFPHNLNAATATALAFVVYSHIPYLGILFCPGAIVMGGVGLF